jgi:hypothetical protein
LSQQINLYEERLRPRFEPVTGRNVGIALGVVLVAIVALGMLARSAAERSTAELGGLQSELKATQETLGALTRTLAERRISPGLQAQVDGAKALLASRGAVMALLDSGQLGNSSGFSDLMSGFARQASGDLWLTGFSVGRGGQEIEIRGRLFDPARLPLYVQRLAGEPAFKGRRFAALDMLGVDPAESKPEAGGAARVPGAAALPRHVDFVLRSEQSAEAPEGGKK